MPRIHLRDFSGGGSDNPPHLIADNQFVLGRNNIAYRNGKWVRRPGYTTPYTDTGASEVIELTEYQRKDATNYFLAFTLNDIWRLDDPGWTSVKGTTTPTGTVTDKWFTTEIADALYATNGVNKVQKATTLAGANKFADMVWDTGGGSVDITIAKTLLAFNNRLLLANTVDGTNGTQPTFLMWTEVNDHDNVQPTNFLNVDETHAPILNIRKLVNNLIAVYKSDSIYTVQDFGDPVFLAPRFRDQVGLWAKKAVTDIPGGNFFVSDQGFFVFVGGGVQPIGEDEVWDYFYSSINQAAKDHIYCFTDHFNREIHILYPSAGNTQPNRDLVFRWQSPQVWQESDFTAYSALYRHRTVNAPDVHFGRGDGEVLLVGGTTDDGTTITSKLRSKAFTMTPNPDVDVTYNIMSIHRYETDALPVGATMKVGSHDSGAGTPSFTSATITAIGGMMSYVDIPTVEGAYISFEAEGFDSITEIRADWTTAGRE